MAIKADDADRSLALHCLDDTSCALVPKAAAQLDGRDAFRDQVLGNLLGPGIVLRSYYRQLDRRRDHLRTVDGRIHLWRVK